MTCEQAQMRLAEHLEKSLDARTELAMREHLEECRDCAELVDFAITMLRRDPAAGEVPSTAMLGRVELMIAAFREGTKNAGGTPAPPGRRLAPAVFALAAACLAVGVFAGRMLPRNGATAPELQALRSEVQETRQLVTLALLQQQSPSGRLEGISWSYSLQRPDAEVMDALLDTVKYDTSVNVRLSAVEALRRFRGNPAVRDGLVEAFAGQNSPLVQIALVDAIAQFRDPQAVAFLRESQAAEGVPAVVRQRAQQILQEVR